MNTRRILLFGAAVVFTAVSSLGAFTLEPIILYLTPSGQESSGVLTLNNPGEKTLAVELSILRRSQDFDGKEIREEAPEGLFTLFPSSLIMEPGSRRTVRIRWTGPQKLEREESFRILAEQLPVDFEEDSVQGAGRISIMFRYLAALYVTPSGADPQVVFQRAPVEELGGRTGNGWVRVENRGRRHQILSQLELSVTTQKKNRFILKEEDLQGLANENVLAGTVRYYRLPSLPEGEEVMDVQFTTSQQ